jgi:hypothetical protein
MSKLFCLFFVCIIPFSAIAEIQSDIINILCKSHFGNTYKYFNFNSTSLSKSIVQSASETFTDTLTNMSYTIPSGWKYTDLSAIVGSQDKALLVTNSNFPASVLIFSYRRNTFAEADYLGPNECFGQCVWSSTNTTQIFGYTDTIISNIHFAYIDYQYGTSLNTVKVIFTSSYKNFTHVCVYSTTVNDYNTNSDIYWKHWENFIYLNYSAQSLSKKNNSPSKNIIIRYMPDALFISAQTEKTIKLELYNLLGKRLLQQTQPVIDGQAVFPLNNVKLKPAILKVNIGKDVNNSILIK